MGAGGGGGVTCGSAWGIVEGSWEHVSEPLGFTNLGDFLTSRGLFVAFYRGAPSRYLDFHVFFLHRSDSCSDNPLNQHAEVTPNLDAVIYPN